MSAPAFDVRVEPVESGKVVYLPLAALSSGGATGVKIVLRLQLRNNETAQVKVSGIRFSFPASGKTLAVGVQSLNKRFTCSESLEAARSALAGEERGSVVRISADSPDLMA